MLLPGTHVTKPSPLALKHITFNWHLWAALVAVLLVAIGVRAGIDLHSGTYFTRSYISEHYSYFEANHLSQMPWYAYLLPNPHMKGTWSTTGFMLNYALDRSLTPLGAHYLVYVASTAAFFAAVYVLTRSVAVALVCATFLAFSPFNLSVYIWHGSNNAYNTLFFASLTLIWACLIYRSAHPRPAVWLAYVGSLWAMALSYEIWLNFAVVVVLAWWPVVLILRRLGASAAQRKVHQLASVFVGTAIIYTLIRSGYLSMTTYAGSEAQMLISKGDVAQFVDDSTHNLFFFPWMTVSQFLPAYLGNSWSIMTSSGTLDVGALTGEYLRNENWPDLDWTILAHHYTMWRFFAGVALTVLVWATVRLYGVAWRSSAINHQAGPTTHIALWGAAMCFAVALGSPSHSLLQVVQFNVWPHYPYKITTSLFCFLLLLAIGLSAVLPRLRRLHPAAPAALVLFLCTYAIANYFFAAPLHNAHIQFVWGEVGFFKRGFYPGLLGNPYHVP